MQWGALRTHCGRIADAWILFLFICVHYKLQIKSREMPSVKSKYQDQLRTHCGGIGTHCRGIGEALRRYLESFGTHLETLGTHWGRIWHTYWGHVSLQKLCGPCRLVSVLFCAYNGKVSMLILKKNMLFLFMFVLRKYTTVNNTAH